MLSSSHAVLQDTFSFYTFQNSSGTASGGGSRILSHSQKQVLGIPTTQIA